MENKDSTFINFANLISSLSPIEFTTLGVITGYILTISLDVQAQNSHSRNCWRKAISP